MTIEELLVRIRETPGCKIEPPDGLPAIEKLRRLPNDLYSFYELCGELSLAENTSYVVTIVPPSKFVLANSVILGEEVAELARKSEGEDISWSWYIIADCGNGDYITIDLDQQRLGRCYDSSHETHGLVGNTPIIALSFTELALSLYDKRGSYWYWLQSDFVSLGDAYDKEL